MTRVVFSPEAEADLVDIVRHAASPTAAFRFAERIRTHCEGFALYPNRGVARDDLLPNLRVVGFERRATIAFRVEKDIVTIARILYRGRNVEVAFGNETN